ncbi:AAA domain-containing protein [Neomoorella carbonis]|uniref:AAA domain-containing protein n=1 Tax=Neomoorella carbonis TaxID=3062783 RepID=UPI00324A1D7B
MSVSANLPLARERLIRIYRFLREYARIRHFFPKHIDDQPWRLWLSELPNHPAIHRGFVLSAKQRVEATAQETETSEFILTVQRPRLTKPPAPPPSLEGWLQPGWEDPLKHDVIPYSSRNVEQPNRETQVMRFEDDEQRVQDFERWRVLWKEWAENERPARQTMKVFETLYELYGRLGREGERVELVVGDGILSWKIEQEIIYHPLLLLPVQLEFDADIPEFRIVDIGRNPELYTVVLRDAPVVNPEQLGSVHEELEHVGFHPLGSEDTSGFFRRLVQILSPHGRFIGNELPPKEALQPIIGRSPVLFLRQRTQGFARALDLILEDLPERENLPSFLSGIVGVEISENNDEPEERLHTLLPGNEPEGVLFSKSWNREQLRIAERLDRYGGVLVQGPPGTGKTHTIANLIGHLLAQGKTVLVTAHTSKALRVLRDQIVDPLRPLCVNVLDDDLESRRQLEEAVNHIAEQLSQSDARTLEEEAAGLAVQRRQLLQEIQSLQQRLLEAVGSEYREIVVAGETFEPSKAGRLVAEGKGHHDWIPEPVEPGHPLPLSITELAELYQTNATVTPEDEQEMVLGLPAPENLLVPEQFAELAAILARPVEAVPSELWESGLEFEESAETLEALAREAKAVGKQLLQAELWELAAAESGFKGEAHCAPWQHLLDLTGRVDRQAAEFHELCILHRPQLAPNIPLDEQERLAVELAAEAERRGGSIRGLSLLLRPAWRRFVQSTSVASGQPRLAEHFRALAAAAGLAQLRNELLARWEYLITRRGGPSPDYLGEEPERAVAQYAPRFRHWLELNDRALLPLVETLQRHGFRWEAFRRQQPPDPSPFGELRVLGSALMEQLPPILEARAQLIRQSNARTKLEEFARRLEALRGRKQSVITEQLYGAVQHRDVETYCALYTRLTDLYRRQAHLQRRQELLARLERVAPGWAAAIRSRQGVHGQAKLPGDPMGAWRWRQLHDELARRASLSVPELQEHLRKRMDTLRQVTAELIKYRAWAAQLRRTTLSQQQALVGWLNIIRRLGKGTGKRAIELRAEAARQLSRAREAVPVWIMPLARVVEQFNPRTTRFDVVIIDEASQCDALALVALYLADRAVVVGDHEQVSPEGVGQELERIEAIITEYLRDIPNAILYDGRRSIYDIARESFGGAIMLVEHFRCVPEIIQFSNLLCYNGRIKPLRESSNVVLKPHVVPYRVKEAYVENRVNRKEALELVSLLVAAVQHPAYEGKTFGVISLVGEEQARFIDSLLRQYLPEREYKKRRILCGTAAQFQGDEREVVFLSLVDAPTGTPLPKREDDRFRQRFNVAASRAKDQMWVVYSLDPHVDLKPGDLRRRLIEYALDPEAATRALINESARTQSPFEREVLQRLVAAGYRTYAQWPVGYYVIDLVVEGSGQRVAIECDGDRWHPLEKLPEDLARQAVLERLGWKFIRIRGSEFYQEPDRTMERVFEQLRSHGIEPEGYLSEGSSSNVRGELIEEIINNATQLRCEWEASKKVESV